MGEVRGNDDGTYTFTGLPGWESHEVRIRAAVLDGHARVTELMLTPVRPDDPDNGLIASRIKSLPLLDLAGVANHYTQDHAGMPDWHANVGGVERVTPWRCECLDRADARGIPVVLS